CRVLYDSFVFQAEDGIRDRNVTGVQTCALPIWRTSFYLSRNVHFQRKGQIPLRVCRIKITGFCMWTAGTMTDTGARKSIRQLKEIGRASCRERAENWGRAASVAKEREQKIGDEG